MPKVTQLLSGEWALDPRPSPPKSKALSVFPFPYLGRHRASEFAREKGWLENLLGVLKKAGGSKRVPQNTVAGALARVEEASLFSPNRKKI